MSELVLTDAPANLQVKSRQDRWLGIAACLAIVWYMMGFFVFLLTLSMGKTTAKALHTPDQIAYLIETPFLVSVANIVVLGAGLIGSVYFLLRRKSAYKWYMLSLFAILATMFDATLRGGFEIMSPSHFGISFAVIIVGIFLFWIAYDARDHKQLN